MNKILRFGQTLHPASYLQDKVHGRQEVGNGRSGVNIAHTYSKYWVWARWEFNKYEASHWFKKKYQSLSRTYQKKKKKNIFV
mgnify:CR=1 FL=1